MVNKPVRVLVSYSHDSDHHKNRVLSLCCKLIQDGVDAEVDQFTESPVEGWPRWMARKLKEVDFVLTVITESYGERFEGRGPRNKGLGSDFEGKLITQLLYNDKSLNSRVIPICFGAKDRQHTPVILQSATTYDVTDSGQYTRLYSILTSQPLLEKPALGPVKKLVSRQIESHQFTDSEATAVADISESFQPLESHTDTGATGGDSDISVCQAIESQLIELHINREFKTFSDTDQDELLKAIKLLLGISGDLKITNKRPGSVFLTLDLSPVDAERLFWLVKNGDLASLNVIDAALLDSHMTANRPRSKEPPEVTASRISAEMFQQQPDWATFFREVLGVDGLVRKLFPTPESLANFERTPEYHAIQAMVAKLRARADAQEVESEPTRVITVRLPKSLHDSLQAEAQKRHTSMNQLCISKLLQVIDEQLIPSE